MILLDTCAVIWRALEEKALSRAAKHAIEAASKNSSLHIADLSLWEMAMLIKKGRLKIETSYLDFVTLVLASENYHVLPITAEISDTAVHLPADITADPADRIIAATAICHKLPLVTADKNLRKCAGLKVIW